MVKVKRYVIFYVSAVSLVAHGSGGIQLSCVTYEAGSSATWNQRYRLTFFRPVGSTSSVEKHARLARENNWHIDELVDAKDDFDR